MSKIALAVIAGDNALDDGFERMVRSVKGEVDGIFVSFNGRRMDIADRIDEIMGDPDLDFEETAIVNVDWVDDFARLRNHSFSLVADGALDYDWILWLDCDDVLDISLGKNLRDVIAEADERHLHGIFIDYIYDYDVNRDAVLASHFKERMFRADARFKWQYPIHENCVGPFSTRIDKVTGLRVLHLRGEVAPKRERNRRIVKAWYERDGDHEARAVMYMGHETFAMAEEAEHERDKKTLYAAALKFYQQFLGMVSSGDDAYAVNMMVADALLKLDRINAALDIALQCVKMEPTRPSGYLAIAEIHIGMGNPEEGKVWANLAMEAGRQSTWVSDTLHAVVPLEGKYKPLMMIGECDMRLGNYEDAERSFELAYGIYPDDFTKGKLTDAAAKVRESRNKTIKFDREEPDVRRAMWGTWPKRSIAFFQPSSIETWDPAKLEDEGLGGTETCIIRLAQEFARNEWRVVVFGNPGEAYANKVDANGIEWYQAGQFHPDEPFTVFVALRNPAPFEAKLAAQCNVLWLHDVTMGPVRTNEDGFDLFGEIDRFVCVSDFHAEHTCDVYGRDIGPRIDVIRNSFDRKLWTIDGPISKIPGKMIYASSPDRGLPRLLELWPRIASRVKDAQLDIFYGWEAIDKIIEAGHPTARRLAYFKQRTEDQLAALLDAGHKITWHGRQPQSVLAEHMRLATVMPYPANFMETYGIVFEQAICSGVIPVVPNLGNLPDLLGMAYEEFVVPGSPDSMAFEDPFIQAVVNANDQQLRKIGSSYGPEWSEAYESWLSMIERYAEVNNPMEVSS